MRTKLFMQTYNKMKKQTMIKLNLRIKTLTKKINSKKHQINKLKISKNHHLRQSTGLEKSRLVVTLYTKLVLRTEDNSQLKSSLHLKNKTKKTLAT